MAQPDTVGAVRAGGLVRRREFTASGMLSLLLATGGCAHGPGHPFTDQLPPRLPLGSNTPAHLLAFPQRQHPLGPGSRSFQGCPALARTGERLWCAWYALSRGAGGGGSAWAGEEFGNYVVLAHSDDGGRSFVESLLVVPADLRTTGAADPALLDIDGALWIVWFQSGEGGGRYDGIGGVWAATCARPTAPKPVWSAPVRLAYGSMTQSSLATSRHGRLWAIDNYSQGRAHRRVPGLEHTWATRVMVQQGFRLGQIGSIPLLPGRYPEGPETSIARCQDGSYLAFQRYGPDGGAPGYYYSRSTDLGASWSMPSDIAALGLAPHANSRATVTVSPSGRLVFVWTRSSRRDALAIALSEDSGHTWPHQFTFARGDWISYPSPAFGPSGEILIAYDRDRHGAQEILLARLHEEAIVRGDVRTETTRISGRPPRAADGCLSRCETRVHA